MGGLEAQLLCSGEGVNIPEGLYNKPEDSVPLKICVFTSASEISDSMALEHSKKNSASRIASVENQNHPIHLSTTERYNTGR